MDQRASTGSCSCWLLPFSLVIVFQSLILRQAATARLGTLLRVHRSKPRFAAVEERLLKLFKERRKAGRKVSAMWMKATARRFAKEIIPKEKFRASSGWLRRFARRNKLTPRSKTNVKLEPLSVRLPSIRHFHRGLRKLLKTPISEDIPLDPVWGRYTPDLRFNMDQVPLRSSSSSTAPGTRRVHEGCGSSSRAAARSPSGRPRSS